MIMLAHVSLHHTLKTKIKLRSFKSSEHIYEKDDGPYHGIGYSSLVSDPLDLKTKYEK